LDGHFSVIQDPSHASLFTLQGWVPQYPSSTRHMNISIKLNSLYGDVPMADKGFAQTADPGKLGSAQFEATRMNVLGGSLTINDNTHTFDHGDVYLQHMWQSTTDKMPANRDRGWDWAWGILDNGWSYSLTHYRFALNSYSNYSYINIVRPRTDGSGTLENIYLHSDQWTRTASAPYWTSPQTNVTYSLGHRLTVRTYHALFFAPTACVTHCIMLSII
jgi:hypothetical protein